MTRLARLRGRAVTVLSADDEGLMNDPGVGLPGRLVLVAIDAPRVHDDARDRVERRRRGGRGRPFAAWASDDPQDEDTQREDTHRLLLKPNWAGSRAAASAFAFRSRRRP